MNLEAYIEGVLFYKSEPVSVSLLARITEASEADVEVALTNLASQLETRGVSLVRAGETVELLTAPGLAPLIEKMRKDEQKRDIGKAGAETLAIVAYSESVTRAEIDFVRGVNSTFILRNLLMRGLIERIENPRDKRSFAYRPTIELYAHLGITKKEDLPEYKEIMEEIERYRKDNAETEEVTV